MQLLAGHVGDLDGQWHGFARQKLILIQPKVQGHLGRSAQPTHTRQNQGDTKVFHKLGQ